VALPVLRLLHLLENRLQLCSVGALKIYFAGPLFTPYERSFIDECAAALRADGFEVFVPHEHELATGVDVTAARIFAKDRPGIERADAMLAILDGPSVDDGTACEIGMFHALMQSDPSKKGIVGQVTLPVAAGLRLLREAVELSGTG
jgi:nucleoside 2-deoxyribosyltransferase-like protein